MGYRRSVADPVHEVEELAHEAELGQSPRTPLIVLGGVSVVLLIVVGILLVVAFLAYYLA
jgi:hypothetical protein